MLHNEEMNLSESGYYTNSIFMFLWSRMSSYPWCDFQCTCYHATAAMLLISGACQHPSILRGCDDVVLPLWPNNAISWKQIWVNIGSGNGLLPDGTKPLPEPQKSSSNVFCGIHVRAISQWVLKSITCVRKLHFQHYYHIFQGSRWQRKTNMFSKLLNTHAVWFQNQ